MKFPLQVSVLHFISSDHFHSLNIFKLLSLVFTLFLLFTTACAIPSTHAIICVSNCNCTFCKYKTTFLVVYTRNFAIIGIWGLDLNSISTVMVQVCRQIKWLKLQPLLYNSVISVVETAGIYNLEYSIYRIGIVSHSIAKGRQRDVNPAPSNFESVTLSTQLCAPVTVSSKHDAVNFEISH